ncbi:hypothetical protein [Streptomyces sp. NBC_00986]|uniref:hypothetical protein n=1 Tax=Streptomyces sp. NBC_00986 TaxID=2903702 RepID=UPI00386EA67E|nr:hypothetical protein OG504_00865 [Streptomyces sp. NBC_00986]
MTKLSSGPTPTTTWPDCRAGPAIASPSPTTSPGRTHEIKDIHALLDGKKTVLRGETISAAAGLDQLARIRDGMFHLTAGYESMIFALGDHQIDLCPYTETYTVDKILNMREAWRELADHGHATVIIRLAEHTPAVRHLGTQQPQ